MNLYYLMAAEHAEPMLNMYPKASHYVDDLIVLTREKPKGYDGLIVGLERLEEYTDLVVKIDEYIASLKAGQATGILVTVSLSQGKQVIREHPDFKVLETNEGII